jgi:hypothetical protein
MSASRAAFVRTTGDLLIETFEDGMAWEDFVDLIPRVQASVVMAIAMGHLQSSDKDAIICELLFHIIDSTDGWGPDSIIDPVLKACISAFLIGDTNG